MDPTKKPTYNMWQNTAFMLGNAWRSYKSVPFLCVGIAVSAAGGTIAQLLLAPAVLEQVETHAPLETLVGVILAFGAVLFALYGLNAYLKENAMYGRVAVRTGLLMQLDHKIADTSFPNLLDTDFLKSFQKAINICSGNSESTEAIWTTLTDLLTNLIGFAVYLDQLERLGNAPLRDVDALLLYDEDEDPKQVMQAVKLLGANGKTVRAQRGRGDATACGQVLQLKNGRLEILATDD